MVELDELISTIPGGGSGPITIEDTWLDFVSQTNSIASPADNGGHTKQIRATHDIAATGDIANRLAVHIRNRPTKRAKWTHRHSENGHRTGNYLLVTYFRLAENDLAKAIRMAEEDEAPHYVGHVLPISNMNNIHIKVIMKNPDEEYVGEDELDRIMKSKDNTRIVRTEFTIIPEPYLPALDSLRDSHVRIIPPGSWEGSIKAILEVPRVYQALSEGSGPIICFTNAVDVIGRTSSFYLKYLADRIGRKIDLAILNQPNFDLPESYQQEHHFFVNPDEAESGKYAKRVVTLPIAKIAIIDDKETIRHDGKIATSLMLQYLIDQGILRWNAVLGERLRNLDKAI